MDKKILQLYLAKNDVPNSEACATLDLPASPWELQDALDRVRLRPGEELYLQIDRFYDFYPVELQVEGQDYSLLEWNTLAKALALMDEQQALSFYGLLQIETKRRMKENAGAFTLQDLCDLAASEECCHVVPNVITDEQLGRFYAENDFLPELTDIPDNIFEWLDFAKIGKLMRCGENGVFDQVGLHGPMGYIVRSEDLRKAPPCPKGLPQRPDYLFHLTLGLDPDLGKERTVTLELPATDAELQTAKEQLGIARWDEAMLTDYDGIIPYVGEIADLPSELERFNAFTKIVRDIPKEQIPKLKALLEHFEVKNLGEVMSLAEHMEDYVLTPSISSPQEHAIGWLYGLTEDRFADLVIAHADLYRLGNAIIQEDNAALTSYGLLNRTDYEPMLSPIQQKQGSEMTMQ